MDFPALESPESNVRPPELAGGLTLPEGRWGAAVSGGADSVALFRLLCGRPGVSLHVVHLDHQTRNGASALDATFVEALARDHGVACTIARREEMERDTARLFPNPSARYRAARLRLFRQTVVDHRLEGVLLAHHADDQAETVLHRLLRESGIAGLAGMSARTEMSGMVLLRPLLAHRRERLREYLREIGQAWREDASNASDQYLRNRLRRWLAREPGLHEAMIELASAARRLRDWSQAAAPSLDETFEAETLRRLPALLARESARRWLVARGSLPGELTAPVLERLISMARDAASPPRVHFPGGLLVRRREGMIATDASTPSPEADR